MITPEKRILKRARLLKSRDDSSRSLDFSTLNDREMGLLLTECVLD